MKNSLMKNLFSLSLGSALLFLHLNLSSEQKPNIILFLVDDMGLMDTSVPMLADKDGKPVTRHGKPCSTTEPPPPGFAQCACSRYSGEHAQ